MSSGMRGASSASTASGSVTSGSSHRSHASRSGRAASDREWHRPGGRAGCVRMAHDSTTSPSVETSAPKRPPARTAAGRPAARKRARSAPSLCARIAARGGLAGHGATRRNRRRRRGTAAAERVAERRLVATVSIRASVSLCPIFGSLAHAGTSPQRNGRGAADSVARRRTTPSGCDGGML